MPDIDENPTAIAWSRPAGRLHERISWGFVFTSWLMAAAAAVTLSALVGWAALQLRDDLAVAGAEIVLVIAACITFLVFAVVMMLRLPLLEHDRLLHSLTVGAVHTIASLILMLAALVLGGSIMGDAAEIGRGGGGDLALVPLALERTAAVSVLACALAAGIMPARGPLPRGAQTERLPTDRQL